MKIFIDCGVNRGQSIWAFSEYFDTNKIWSYIGFEPAIKGLQKNSFQINEMRKNFNRYSKRYHSAELIPKAVGSRGGFRVFWWSYGAGSTGLFSLAIRMFIRDLMKFEIRKALRFFKINIVSYCDIVKFVEIKKKQGFFVCLKLDIEGGEFEILKKMYQQKIFPDQLMIEYHAPKVGYPIPELKELHKNIYDQGVEIYLWGAEFDKKEPPMKRLGRLLDDSDC